MGRPMQPVSGAVRGSEVSQVRGSAGDRLPGRATPADREAVQVRRQRSCLPGSTAARGERAASELPFAQHQCLACASCSSCRPVQIQARCHAVAARAGTGRSARPCAAGGKQAVSDALSGLKDALGPPKPSQTPNSTSIAGSASRGPAQQPGTPAPDTEQGSMKPPGPDTVQEMGEKHNMGWHDAPDSVWSDSLSWPDSAGWPDAAGRVQPDSTVYVQQGGEGFGAPEFSAPEFGGGASPPGAQRAGSGCATSAPPRPACRCSAASCDSRARAGRHAGPVQRST